MTFSIEHMKAALKISSTGYWESDIKLYHVRCEPICTWISTYLNDQKDRPLYDFGCGNGHYLNKLKELGFTNLTGFEGKIPKQQEFDNIIAQDLTQPFSVPLKGNCLFLEVAEHIPAQFEDLMLDNVIGACDNLLVMSWAVRGQAGDGHVNCLDNHEVIDRVTKRGLIYLPKETEDIRNSIPNNNPYFWFKTTTLIFEKK